MGKRTIGQLTYICIKLANQGIQDKNEIFYASINKVRQLPVSLKIEKSISIPSMTLNWKVACIDLIL
ncbi:hypothetical protein [Oceanobacillus halotolerans]|uniref:hypothetical protein n=1 Tax=Oceanobacillus halotolerans TaxID=2663380 RepID=UPI0013D17F49|nr:hypothetical protein [Oceanobacillus halotolerans]